MSDNSTLINEITSLRDILINSLIIKDPTPIEDVLAQFRRNLQNNTCQYQLVDLTFVNDKKYGHVRPIQITPSASEPIEIRLGADVKVNTSYEFSDIQSMNIDIEYEASWIPDEETQKIIIKKSHGSWHLDYHLPSGQPTTFIHPMYHFHHGGRKMYNHQDYGNIMIMDAPRVAHPPLDIVLSIDFVIANFLGDKWNLLMQDSAYTSLIKNAQDRWWRQYYLDIAAFWGHTVPVLPTSAASSLSARNILPSLI